jgi:hypothetical protein
VQDTVRRPVQSARPRKLAPGAPPESGKNRIRKAGIDFKSLRKIFRAIFPSALR